MDIGLLELLWTRLSMEKRDGPGAVSPTLRPPFSFCYFTIQQSRCFSLDPCLAPAVTGGSWRGELVLFAVSCWKCTGFRLLLVPTAPL